MSELTLTKENFDASVLNADKPVLVDFWASWCGPCRMIAPVVKQIAEQYEGKLAVGKVNVDEQGELASRYQVSSIPTLLVFSGGKLVQKSVGAQGKEALEKLFTDLL